MPYELTSDDRQEFEQWFSPPFPWSLRRHQEVMRYWQVLSDGPGEVVLMHGTGACASLSLAADTVIEVRLHEGDQATPFLRRLGFQVTDDVRRWVRQHLSRGHDADQALDANFLRRGGLVALPEEPGKRRYRIGQGGVLEVDVGANGAVMGHRFLTGGAALDVLDAAIERKRWDYPAYAQNPVQVRTRAEARLYVAVQKGSWETERLVGNLLQVLVRIPEGRRVFDFDVADPRAAGMGSGSSPCLDPAELVLFAARVEANLPDPQHTTTARCRVHTEQLGLAAEALRQAARFIPPGADLPPADGIYHTLPAAFYRQRNPDRFRRAHLVSEAGRLDTLAAIWASAVGGRT